MNGKFFVIEGLGKCGKATQSLYLREYLRGRKGQEVVLTKEPDYNTESGQIIQMILNETVRISERDTQTLFAKNRRDHLIDVIEPAIRLGGIVISSRYRLSTIAYGAGAGLDINVLIKENFPFRSPDFTFFLNVPVDICLERVSERQRIPTHFETKDKMVGAQKVFLELAEMFPDKIAVIDGEQKEEDVADYITTIINQKNLI